MSVSRKRNITLLISAFAVILMLFIFASAKPVYAGVIEPSGEVDTTTDKNAIQWELEETGKVKLVSGKTYYLSGPIFVKSNMSIDATGATVICYKTAFYNIPERAGYKAIENLTVKGGTWKYFDSNGYKGSSMKIIHGNNIKLQNMKIRHNNAKGHAIELIACKNAVVSGCDIAPLGKDSSKTEEAIQLDIATHTTAYFLEGEPFITEKAKALQNGATCQNIKIEKNKIKGNRGVVANYTKKEGGKYLKKLHSNITLKNNTITGTKGEAVALFNTKSAVVSGNKIYTKAKGNDAYTVGLHIANFGKTGDLKKGKITVEKNTVKGGRQALLVYSHTSSKYGTVTIKSNKLYCKKGKKQALRAEKKQIKKLKTSKNKTYKWNGK